MCGKKQPRAKHSAHVIHRHVSFIEAKTSQLSTLLIYIVKCSYFLGMYVVPNIQALVP